MPRLSLYKPTKTNDYYFMDKTIAEQFLIGGTEILIHKYIGVEEIHDDDPVIQADAEALEDLYLNVFPPDLQSFTDDAPEDLTEVEKQDLGISDNERLNELPKNNDEEKIEEEKHFDILRDTKQVHTYYDGSEYYIPSYEIDQIGEFESTEGYKVFINWINVYILFI